MVGNLLLLAFAALIVVPFAAVIVHNVRHPKALIWQFGKFTNRREGIKHNLNWGDEPEIVEYTDYKYWIRLRPNPGVNLPVIGYWSRARGRKGP